MERMMTFTCDNGSVTLPVDLPDYDPSLPMVQRAHKEVLGTVNLWQTLLKSDADLLAQIQTATGITPGWFFVGPSHVKGQSDVLKFSGTSAQRNSTPKTTTLTPSGPNGTHAGTNTTNVLDAPVQDKRSVEYKSAIAQQAAQQQQQAMRQAQREARIQGVIDGSDVELTRDEAIARIVGKLHAKYVTGQDLLDAASINDTHARDWQERADSLKAQYEAAQNEVKLQQAAAAELRTQAAQYHAACELWLDELAQAEGMVQDVEE